MSRIAKRLALDGWVLRSGGTGGADDIFEQTCMDAALIYHPNPEAITNNIHVWKLMARNVQQVLGVDLLQETSKFVVCWTPDGVERGNDTTKKTGGTGQAIRIASSYHVPVFNLKNPDSFAAVNELIDSFNNSQHKE